MERSHELKSISQVRRQEGVVQADIEVQTAHSRDRDELARQGKKEVLKVRGRRCSIHASKQSNYIFRLIAPAHTVNSGTLALCLCWGSVVRL